MVDMTAFKKWVASQPEDATYNYQMPDSCALARYLQERGESGVRVMAMSYTASGREVSLPEGLDDALRGRSRWDVGLGEAELALLPRYWTFGGLARRLEKVGA